MGIHGAPRAGRVLGIAVATAMLGATPALASGNRVLGSAPASQSLQLVFPLKVDGAGLRRFALAVSNPQSPSYGHYRSISWLSRRFGASAAERRRVVGYLRSHDATDIHVDATGLSVDATIPVGTAQRLFATPLVRVETATGVRYVAPARGAKPRIPRTLAGSITGVVGLDAAPVPISSDVVEPHAKASGGDDFGPELDFGAGANRSSELPRTGTPHGCAAGVDSGAFTPNQYLTAFGFSPLQQDGYLGQGERVAVIEVNGVDSGDVATFAQCFGLPSPNIAQHLVGRSTHPSPAVETTLDLDMLVAAAPELSGIDVYETSTDVASVLKSFTAPLQDRADRPAVLSISLGVCEQALFASVNGAAVQDAEYGLLEDGASGITVVGATGDAGSTACLGKNGTPVDELAVNYPAASSYALAVGGTNVALSPSNQITDEVVWNDEPDALGAGGGGFSAGERPAWQYPFVSAHRGRVGKLRERAVPDVAMLADPHPGYAVYCTTSDCQSAGTVGWPHLGGTSAAAPLLAGGIALVDQALQHANRNRLGLIAPFLYLESEHPAYRNYLFRDVTSGNNDIGAYLPGGHGKAAGCCSARPGFDQASGFGSLDLYHLATFAVTVLPDIDLHISVSIPPHQNPIRTGSMTAVVSCSTGCYGLTAAASVTVGHAKRFDTFAPSAHDLSSAGSVRFRIAFTRKQLRKLRAGVRRRDRIVATVYGAVADFNTTLKGIILNVRGEKRIVLAR